MVIKNRRQPPFLTSVSCLSMPIGSSCPSEIKTFKKTHHKLVHTFYHCLSIKKICLGFSLSMMTSIIKPFWEFTVSNPPIFCPFPSSNGAKSSKSTTVIILNCVLCTYNTFITHLVLKCNNVWTCNWPYSTKLQTRDYSYWGLGEGERKKTSLGPSKFTHSTWWSNTWL